MLHVSYWLHQKVVFQHENKIIKNNLYNRTTSGYQGYCTLTLFEIHSKMYCNSESSTVSSPPSTSPAVILMVCVSDVSYITARATHSSLSSVPCTSQLASPSTILTFFSHPLQPPALAACSDSLLRPPPLFYSYFIFWLPAALCVPPGGSVEVFGRKWSWTCRQLDVPAAIRVLQSPVSFSHLLFSELVP